MFLHSVVTRSTRFACSRSALEHQVRELESRDAQGTVERDRDKRRFRSKTLSLTLGLIAAVVLAAYGIVQTQIARQSLVASRLASASYEASASDKELALVLARTAVETRENQETVGALRKALNDIIGSTEELLTAPATILLQRSRTVAGRELTAEERQIYFRQ